MDDVLLQGRSIQVLKTKLENVLDFCREKRLKLRSPKLQISEQVEFGGALIGSELVQKEQIVCIQLKDRRIQTFYNLTKNDK